MAIRFRCTCGSKLLVPDNFAGRQVRCPACRQFNAVPRASDARTESRSGAPPAARSSTEGATEQTTSKSLADTSSSRRSQPPHEPLPAAQPSQVVPPEAPVAASPTTTRAPSARSSSKGMPPALVPSQVNPADIAPASNSARGDLSTLRPKPIATASNPRVESVSEAVSFTTPLFQSAANPADVAAPFASPADSQPERTVAGTQFAPPTLPARPPTPTTIETPSQSVATQHTTASGHDVDVAETITQPANRQTSGQAASKRLASSRSTSGTWSTLSQTLKTAATTTSSRLLAQGRQALPTPSAAPSAAPSEDQARRPQVKIADERLVATARLLGWALAGIAIVGWIPALWEITVTYQAFETSGVGRWVYLLIWLTVMHGAYAIYVGQLPDTSSLWMVTLFTLAMATFYAGLLGITLVVRPETTWLADLDLLEQLQGRRASGWCFIMLCLESLLSYLSGRASFRWSNSPTASRTRTNSTGR